jgi:hypothetical protein
MLSKKEFCQRLEPIRDLQKRERELAKLLSDLDFFNGHFVVSHTAKIITNYIECIAELVGDNSGWIEWFIYDNDWGRQEMEAGMKHKMKKIRTSEQLYDLIKGCGDTKVFDKEKTK